MKIPILVSATVAAVLVYQVIATGLNAPPVDKKYPSTRAARESLRAKLKSDTLELSTAATSDSDWFCLEFALDVPPNNSAQSLRIFVVRDRDRVAMLLRDVNGNCYTYATNGLLVSVDHDHPGTVNIARNGFPCFFIEINAEGKLHINCSYDQGATEPRIMVALGSCLELAINRSTSISYDDPSKFFWIKTNNSAERILFVEPLKAGHFSIKDYEMLRANSLVRILILDTAAIPQRFAGLLGDPIVLEKALANDGTPVVDLTKVYTPALAGAFVMPAELGRDPREQQVINKLATLLLVPAASQPSQ